MSLTRRSTTYLFLFAALVLATTSGCRVIKYKIGMTTTVENPEPGSPEATVQAALRAALDGNEEDGWRKFETLLHSNQRTSPASLKEWRTLRFNRMRKQTQLYVKDMSTTKFEIANERELDDGTLELYIENTMAELPTPCAVRQDSDGAWRITRCSL